MKQRDSLILPKFGRFSLSMWFLPRNHAISRVLVGEPAEISPIVQSWRLRFSALDIIPLLVALRPRSEEGMSQEVNIHLLMC